MGPCLTLDSKPNVRNCWQRAQYMVTHEELEEVVPRYIYNLNILKQYFDLLVEAPMKQRLLSHIPYSVNYTVRSNILRCRPYEVKKHCLIHTRTNLTLEEHFRVAGLTEECEIGFNYEDQSSLEMLHNWTKSHYESKGYRFDIRQIKMESPHV